jgi:hypothetical protein
MLTGRSRELDFLLDCCLGSKTDLSNMRAIDRRRLTELALRHRVAGLLWQRLAASGAGASSDVLAALGDLHRAQSLAYLTQLNETLRLSGVLQAEGHPVIALKGCALAYELYETSPGLRHAQDIDLLVSPQHFREAGKILVAEGYVRRVPVPDMRRSAESMALYLTNVFEFVHPKRALKVELHHRLLADPYIMAIPFAELLTRSRTLEFGNRTLRVLGPADLTVYLCCHAAFHAFFRLKWLADIARLLERGGQDTVRMMLTHARTLACERHVLLTLLILEQLSGSHMTAPVVDKQREEWATPWLVIEARRALLRENLVGSFCFADLVNRARTLTYDICLGVGWRSRMFHVLRHLCHIDDMSILRLGVEWRWLYAILGRPLALLRLLNKRSAANEESLT